jgi:hypothetical protein
MFRIGCGEWIDMALWCVILCCHGLRDHSNELADRAGGAGASGCRGDSSNFAGLNADKRAGVEALIQWGARQ